MPTDITKTLALPPSKYRIYIVILELAYLTTATALIFYATNPWQQWFFILTALRHTIELGIQWWNHKHKK